MNKRERKTGSITVWAAISLGCVLLAIAAYFVSDKWAWACEKGELNAWCARQPARAPGLGTLVLPSGVSVQPGFPIVAAEISCSPGVMFDIDGASGQEALFGVAQGPGSGDVQKSYDALWAAKGDGKCAKKWPVTIPGHVCSGPAVGDITGSSDVEVVVGSDQDPGNSSKRPDHRVYAFSKDGSPVSGFPKELEAGKVEGIPTLADIAGDSKLEIILGTAGYWTKSGNAVTQCAGKRVALEGDGDFVTGWNKAATSAVIINSAAVGDLYEDGNKYVGKEIVFVASKFSNTQGNPSFEQHIWVFDKSGKLMLDYNLANGNDAERCYSAGYGAASPAIGVLKSYGTETKSNLVVLTENSWDSGKTTGTVGTIKIYHIAKVSGAPSLVEDTSVDADEQSCGSNEESYDTFVSSPCIGDLDGDGQNEVVAYSRYGQLYVVDYISSSFVTYTEEVVDCANVAAPCSHQKISGPILVDIDDDNGDHPDLEIIVAALPPTGVVNPIPYIRVYNYDSTAQDQITKSFEIELDALAVATVCAGEMDTDDKVEVIAQAYGFGGRVWAFQFDNSDYDSSAGWWCECGNAARTSCAD